MLFGLTIFIVLISTLDPSVHVRFVCPGIVLFSHALFSDLVSKHIVELLVLGPRLVLGVDVLQASSLVLLKTLLDVLLLLLHLQFFSIIANHLTHAIHNGLDATTALGHLLLTSLLFLQLHAHVLFNLLGLLLSNLFQLSLSLLFLDHIVLDNLHCSLTLSSLDFFFVLLLFFYICSQFGNTFSFFLLTP